MKKLILIIISLFSFSGTVNAQQYLCGMQPPGEPCSIAVLPLVGYGVAAQSVRSIGYGLESGYRIASNVRPLPAPYYHTHSHNFQFNAGPVNWNYGSGPHYQVGVYVRSVPGSQLRVQVPAFLPEHRPVFR